MRVVSVASGGSSQIRLRAAGVQNAARAPRYCSWFQRRRTLALCRSRRFLTRQGIWSTCRSGSPSKNHSQLDFPLLDQILQSQVCHFNVTNRRETRTDSWFHCPTSAPPARKPRPSHAPFTATQHSASPLLGATTVYVVRHAVRHPPFVLSLVEGYPAQGKSTRAVDSLAVPQVLSFIL